MVQGYWGGGWVTITKVLTVKQPWAHLIIHGGIHADGRRVFKTIENRSRRTHYRGRIWIHAGKGVDKTALFYHRSSGALDSTILEHGGIIGSVEIVDVIQQTSNPEHKDWFIGPYGWVLASPEPCEFRPMRGQLGLWNLKEV